MIDARDAAHTILHKDPHAYSAHPQVAWAANGDWLVVFNKAPRRPLILHPPQDPLFANVIIRSGDHGASWSEPVIVPNEEYRGTECASLTTLLSSERILLNQWRFHWIELDLAYPLANDPTGKMLERLVERKVLPRSRAKMKLNLRFPRELLRGLVLSPEIDAFSRAIADPDSFIGFARDGGETFVHISDDHGHSWRETCRIDTSPYDGGYGMRGACELPNGDLLLPLSDVPHWRVVFVVRSSDDGKTWSRPVEVADVDGKEFEEPSLISLKSGRLLMLLRENVTRHLHRCVSDDAGGTWSAPRQLPIEGYPPHLLQLPDGRVLCTIGWRYPDFGIRAVLSADDGETWDVDRTIRIRGGLPNKDLGYPCTLLDADGSLFTVYYGQDDDGVTCIMATRWHL
jgi:BNR repeat-like domain